MTNNYPGPKPNGHDLGHGEHRGHSLLMILCCIPMVAIAVVLVATGVAGSGVVLAALACITMMAAMAVMMFMMVGGPRSR